MHSLVHFNESDSLCRFIYTYIDDFPLQESPLFHLFLFIFRKYKTFLELFLHCLNFFFFQFRYTVRINKHLKKCFILNWYSVGLVYFIFMQVSHQTSALTYNYDIPSPLDYCLGERVFGSLMMCGIKKNKRPK